MQYICMMVILPTSLFASTQESESGPTLEVTPKQILTDDAVAIGSSVAYAEFEIAASGLTRDVAVYLTGTSRDMFSLDTETIAAGTESAVVKLSYNPTETGRHTARVNFDAVPTELSCGFSATAYCYDPANPPTITIPESVTLFEAEPTASASQTIQVSTANLLDFGKIVVDASTPGSFLISTGMLLKDGTQNIKIDFLPKTPGDYTATLTFSALRAETRVLKLTGRCVGEIPIPKDEGEPLKFDTSSPLKLMNENFDRLADYRNKFFTLEGWCNTVPKGNRAWWGYSRTEEDNSTNHVAKVTAYDSKASTESPCEMLLMTPALDFKGAASKLLTFRIMGDFLPETPDGRTSLEICYIDIADGDDKPYYQAWDGLGIPADANHSKEWVDYVVDLEGQEIADVFFIGFRFRSVRCNNEASTYYIDNVSWGRTDVAQIKISDRSPISIGAPVGLTRTSEEIEVTGLNLPGPISATITGPNASKFAPTVAELPAEGGRIAVSFSPEEAGLHEAYLNLSANGAPTISIQLLGSGSAGIDGIEADETGTLTVYSLQGVQLIDRGSEADLNRLPRGLYIVNGEKQILR